MLNFPAVKAGNIQNSKLFKEVSLEVALPLTLMIAVKTLTLHNKQQSQNRSHTEISTGTKKQKKGNKGLCLSLTHPLNNPGFI